MSRLQARIAVLLVLVVLVLAGGAATDFGNADTTLTVDRTAERTPDSPGIAFEVRTVLNNSRPTSVTETVELVVTGDEIPALTVDERTVTVPAESTTTLTLAAPTDAVSPGEYGYSIVVGDTSSARASGNVTLASPQFEVDQVWSEPVVHGQPGEVSTAVHNRGDYRGMRTVRLLLDRNQDGAYSSEETIATKAPLLPPDGRTTVTFALPTDGLEPGTYTYRVEGTTTREGELTIEHPATFRISDMTVTTSRSRGERFNATVTLVNVGDVTGGETVRVTGPGSLDRSRTVTLTAGEVRTVEFTLDTSNLTRGNYTVRFEVANETRTGELRVRDSHFEVASVSGPEQIDLGRDLEFTARVRNTGDLAGNQTVAYRIDLNGDDEPETRIGNRTVALAPGEETTVTFAVDDVDGDELLGTHIYGVYSEDSNATGVVVVEEDDDDDGSSTSSSTGDDVERVSLDEISQEKYGYYFEELSSETQTQVREIYERQPFADGLVVTEVLTREQIARQRLGLDVDNDFDFTALDVQDQQRIENMFDEQFQSDEGDRVESWDELAQRLYGSDYESLTESQQQTIRDRYWEQFEDGM